MKFVSTGISISSINHIKELAEEKKYAEALKILDTQNLDKSINPQFLRISGEIFRENKRYYDSRRILLKSHQMSPQGIRIIFELIQLYLELGYYTRAKKYYEQYQFYSTPEDAQKDYIEYLMKKAMGTDVKELASILIPILERMPDDKWNFEAVLLYDKLGRKDKALEESQYILENFKDSIFVKPVIEYIDDRLDVDAYFYKYPKEEVSEDEEIFGDLIAEDDRILVADYLRMYPPEARIMVEAEDKETIDVKPVKEKKPKRKRKKRSKAVQDVDAEEAANIDVREDDKATTRETNQDAIEISVKSDGVNEKISADEQEPHHESEEERIRKERESALENLLSKKMDKEKIRESAKQVAKAVKDIDTTKAKSQVLSVTESVRDNVKKATDVIGEVVGSKVAEDIVNPEIKEEQIVDGIIESVLEPPKKVIGQVVVNEELDALVPDSLEAISAEEIAELEAKKEEAERMELEALEASLELKEAKKKANDKTAEEELEHHVEDGLDVEECSVDNTERKQEIEQAGSSLSQTVSFEELKAKFLAESKAEEKPLESLGFISTVQSDVDEKMEAEIPDAANMLHQMIDNKEFYQGEDSTKFESKASYDNHGFEVEDYDFDSYWKEEDVKKDAEESEQEAPAVEVIYSQEAVVDFDEIVPQDAKEHLSEEKNGEILTEQAVVEEIPEKSLEDEPVVHEYQEEELFEGVVYSEEPIVEEKEQSIEEIVLKEKESTSFGESMYMAVEEDAAGYQQEVTQEQQAAEAYIDDRENVRVGILLSDNMVTKLFDLKESR